MTPIRHRCIVQVQKPVFRHAGARCINRVQHGEHERRRGTTDTTAPSAPSAFLQHPPVSYAELKLDEPGGAVSVCHHPSRHWHVSWTTTTDGTSVVSGSQRPAPAIPVLTDGTYYYIFARDVRGNFTRRPLPWCHDQYNPSSSSGSGGEANAGVPILLRQQNGLDMWGNPLPQAFPLRRLRQHLQLPRLRHRCGNIIFLISPFHRPLSRSSISAFCSVGLPCSHLCRCTERFRGIVSRRVAARILKILGFGC